MRGLFKLNRMYANCLKIAAALVSMFIIFAAQAADVKADPMSDITAAALGDF
jgi:hypothetical protein